MPSCGFNLALAAGSRLPLLLLPLLLLIEPLLLECVLLLLAW
jgi:hypothetical protein